MIGFALAALSGVGFALFQVTNMRTLHRRTSPHTITFCQLVIAALVLAAVVPLTDREHLGRLDAGSVAYFATAGLLQFLVGWTLVNVSQSKIGASRSSPLIAMTPLFGVVSAGVLLAQVPSGIMIVAIVGMIAGAVVIARAPLHAAAASWRGSAPALLAAVSFALSPIFAVRGLAQTPAPILGADIGMIVSCVVHGTVFRSWLGLRLDRGILGMITLAGVAVAVSTYGRWAALELIDVVVVLALGLVSVPAVLVLAPLVVGRTIEPFSARVWLGSALIVGGALVLVLR